MNHTDYARVLMRRAPALVLGPLGVFDRGDEVDIDGQVYVVTNIDPDGAGVAVPSFLADDHRYSTMTTCKPITEATPLSQAGMKAQQERNRRLYRTT